MSSSHPVTAVGTYVAVFVALLIGTALTVYVAYFDFGFLNTAIALGVAVAKASLVVSSGSSWACGTTRRSRGWSWWPGSSGCSSCSASA